MNFFEAQESARRATSLLVLLFVLGVAGLVVTTNLFVLAVIAYLDTGELAGAVIYYWSYFNWQNFFVVGAAVCTVVMIGSLYKVSQLSAGARVVAEALGGRLIPPDSPELLHRKILNVVEEMAIASGVPVPPVYLLKERGINAFAAGFSHDDVVIGITVGAVKKLSRDELQGVIAHEFSHIFNGDMRLNMHLTGLLNGILLIGLIGRLILRSLRYGRSGGRSKSGANTALALLILGSGLTVIGFVGAVVGELIKAMVSRQREFLADASAVEYTRNPEGVAGALKKIGGYLSGSAVKAPSAAVYSHFYFADADKSFFDLLFSTHPPLARRIRRIDPHWDGTYTITHANYEKRSDKAPYDAFKKRKKEAAASLSLATAIAALDYVGHPLRSHVINAEELISSLPGTLQQQTRHPLGAQAVILALLSDTEPLCRKIQWERLRNSSEILAGTTEKVWSALSSLNRDKRLPLLELSMPALRTLSPEQYKNFRRLVTVFIESDRTLSLFEWCLEQLVMRPLDTAFGLRRSPVEMHHHLGAVKREAELLLSVLARSEHPNEEEARVSFYKATASIGAGALEYAAAAVSEVELLDTAVDVLQKAKAPVRGRILAAATVCVSHNGIVTTEEIELLHATASLLHLPLPPIAQLTERNNSDS